MAHDSKAYEIFPYYFLPYISKNMRKLNLVTTENYGMNQTFIRNTARSLQKLEACSPIHAFNHEFLPKVPQLGLWLATHWPILAIFFTCVATSSFNRSHFSAGPAMACQHPTIPQYCESWWRSSKVHQKWNCMEECLCGKLFWINFFKFGSGINEKCCRWCWFMLAITCWIFNWSRCIVPASDIDDIDLFLWSWPLHLLRTKICAQAILQTLWDNPKLKLPHIKNEFPSRIDAPNSDNFHIAMATPLCQYNPTTCPAKLLQWSNACPLADYQGTSALWPSFTRMFNANTLA